MEGEIYHQNHGTGLEALFPKREGRECVRHRGQLPQVAEGRYLYCIVAVWTQAADHLLLGVGQDSKYSQVSA